MKKTKTYEVSVINKTLSKTYSDQTKFYTSDTALELNFQLKEVEYDFDSAEIILLNVDDRSLVTRPVAKNADGFTYELEDDIVTHYGEWKGQLKFDEGGEIYVSSPVSFRIENDLTNDRPPQLTEVNTWKNLRKIADGLIADIRSELELFEEKKLEIEAAESERQSAELIRIENEKKRQLLSDKMYQVVSNDEFDIYSRLNQHEFVKYKFKTNGQENYIRPFDIMIAETGRSKEYGIYTYENPTVEVLGTQTNNHYVTEIGGKVYLNFYGTGVEFNYYSRTDGGVWRPKIDGKVYQDISTYNVSSKVKSTVISDNLPQTDHILEFEFIGADPNTIGTPRGWMRGEDAFVVTYEGDGIAMVDKFELTATASNKDFAFHVKPRDIEGEEQFFPLHSGNDTTNAVERKLLIDGNVIDMTSSRELTPFKTGSFTEVLESKMTYDTSLRAKGKILWEFKEDRLYQELEYEFLKDSMIVNGYVFMIPVQKQYFDYLKTDKREVVNQSDADVGISTNFNDLNIETIRAYFTEPHNMYNLEVGIDNRSHDYRRVWLQRRNDSLSKLYPQPLLHTDFNVGDKLYFDGYFKVNNVFN